MIRDWAILFWNRQEQEKLVRDAVIKQGRVAYRFGLRQFEDCPAFYDPDMSINWRMGWRWEKEEHDRRPA